ncbi:MAG: hypothetical protein HOW73_18680 [Polyangiaceae bacterium]|nr:hypothetical protein [Polyangiaceae bacterium]
MRSPSNSTSIRLGTSLFAALSGSIFLSACAGEARTTEPENPTSPTPMVTAEASAPTTSTSEPVATAEPQPSVSAASGPTALPSSAPAQLPKGMKVLVIGDSFAEALGVGLKSKEAETGVKVVLRGEKATYIPEWAGPNRGVAGMMIQEKPDLVVVALGGNELAMTNPDVRGPKVKQLVGLFGSTPCVWVSPPLWGNKDNGLLEVIRKNSSPCRYFDSNVLSPDLPRGSDKIHPTAEGQKKWAGTFLDWAKKERDGASSTFSLKVRPSDE